jgi:hypothetical protein
MPYLKIKGDARRYWIRDRDCLATQCLAPGLYPASRRDSGWQSQHGGLYALLYDQRLSRLFGVPELFEGTRRATT